MMALVLTFVGWGTVRSMADHDAWSHDRHGYWDDHRGYHSFVSYNHHHGYWRTRSDGVRFFINVD